MLSIPDIVHPSEMIQSEVFIVLPSQLIGGLMVKYESTHMMFFRYEGKSGMLGLLFSNDVLVMMIDALDSILIAP